MNKIMLTGRATADAEIRYTQSSNPTAQANFTLAVKRRFAKNSETDTDFFRCVAWGKTAEFCEKYLTKGRRYEISGRMEISKYTANGETKTYYSVVVEEIDFGDTKKDAENLGLPTRPNTQATTQGYTSFDDDDDDLPF